MARPQKTLRPTRPNAGTAAWYRRKLEAEVQAMHKSLLWWIEAQYKAGGFAMDAGETDAERLQREMERLREQWTQHFESLGERLAKMFAKKVMGYADYNAKTAFQAIGMTVSMTMTDAMQQAYQGVIGEQVGLIRSIAEQHLGNVERLVMESVHCRVGSSEMCLFEALAGFCVHCRVGSSEITQQILAAARQVHCRVGSSEIPLTWPHRVLIVHCRVGSSEMAAPCPDLPALGSLPSRQLRNG